MQYAEIKALSQEGALVQVPMDAPTMTLYLHSQDRTLVESTVTALAEAGWVCNYSVPSSTAGKPHGVSLDFAWLPEAPTRG